MAKAPKEPKPERWQTHVYLSPDDFGKLKQIADSESRSTTGQIEYFLRQSIAAWKPSLDAVGPERDRGGKTPQHPGASSRSADSAGNRTGRGE